MSSADQCDLLLTPSCAISSITLLIYLVPSHFLKFGGEEPNSSGSTHALYFIGKTRWSSGNTCFCRPTFDSCIVHSQYRNTGPAILLHFGNVNTGTLYHCDTYCNRNFSTKTVLWFRRQTIVGQQKCLL